MLVGLEQHYPDFEHFFQAAHESDVEPGASTDPASKRPTVRVPLVGKQTIDAAVHGMAAQDTPFLPPSWRIAANRSM